MMHQEINLYNQLSKPQPTTALVSWRQFWICNAIFFGGLVAISIFLQINIFILQSSESSLLLKEKELQQNFFTIKSHYPGLFFSQNVAKTVDDLQKELVSGENFLRGISTQIPISTYLSILSNTILPDIWLSKISIKDDGENIYLKGKTLTTQSVQQFLEILVNEKAFSGYILNVNNIGPNVPDNQPVEFEINMVKKNP